MSVPEVPSLSAVQRHRKQRIFAFGAFAFLLMFFLASAGPPESPGHEAVEAAGVALILLCILGRTWCTLYIGGKKKHALVTGGPYSVVRNPLYVFSLLGAAGVGMTTGSVIIGGAVAAAAFLVFGSVVEAEERFLADAFGAPYRRYCARVPRWLPRYSAWRDEVETVVRPRLVLCTFRDACVFLIAVPVFEQIDRLHEAGLLPVLAHLP